MTKHLKDMNDTAIKVIDPVSGETVQWMISQNLTDRWGEINDHDADHKPLGLLGGTPGLLDRLRSQMGDSEDTFIARKDGVFGILIEIEFRSAESEDDAKLKSHGDVVAALKSGLAKLAAEHPSVEFAIPDAGQIYSNRPAAWAFYKDGALSARQIEELCVDMWKL